MISDACLTKMSDHGREPDHQGDARARQSVQCYQSVWMAHWTQKSCSAAAHIQNVPFISPTSNGDYDANKHHAVSGLPVASDVPTSSKKFTEVTDMRTIRIMTTLGSGTSSREHVFHSERVSQSLEEPAAPKICLSNKGKAPALSFMNKQEKAKQLSFGLASKEYISSTNRIDAQHEISPEFGNFTMLGCEKWDELSASEKFLSSKARQGNASLLLRDPSKGNHQIPILGGEPSWKMQTFQGTGFLPSQYLSLKESKSVNLSHESCTLQESPVAMRDAETMRTANFTDGLAEVPATHSQTTHSLLFAKNADLKKSEENQGFQDSRDLKKANGNMFSDLLRLSPPLALGQRGGKIQLLDNSSDSRLKDCAGQILTPGFCPRNESSAETDILDMESFKEQSNPSGADSFVPNKNFVVDHDPSSQAAIVSGRKELESKQAMALIADMNENPVLPVSPSSTDAAEPSTSRTESLDAELLLTHTEQPINCKTKQSSNGYQTLETSATVEPSCRWLKRLKFSVSDSFGIATKTTNLGEASSHQKVNKFLGEEQSRDHSAILVHKVESSSGDPSKEDLASLLSHSWIRRWLHKRAATQNKKLEAVVVCEPLSSKVDLDELQNKQLPSIGALALMGKAMKGFRPCEFQRRGSFIVWGAKGQ